MANTKGGLGKGLNALFIDSNAPIDYADNGDRPVQDIDISLIDRNPNQPRKNFNESALRELSESIAMYGVLQPLLLVKSEGGRYMIIAGERRYRASLKAGLAKVPAIVREFTPQQVQEISLIENLQREDLNAIEAAMGMRELMDNHGLTQDDVAKCIGKSRPYVTNTLRLLQLPKEVTDMVREGLLSPGHARTLISIDDKDYSIMLAKRICEKHMSVREIEKEVNLYQARQNIPQGARTNRVQTLEMRELINDMRRIFKTKVSCKGNAQKGRVMIDYFTPDDLQRIYDMVALLKNSNGDK